MKTLIISMTCGEGHNQIAKALKAELDNRGEDVKIIQLYGFNDKEVAKQNKLFLNACKFIPHLYESIWKSMRKRKPHKPSFVINQVIKDCSDYCMEEIESYKPDNIICTHNNAGAVISKLKKDGKLNGITTYGVVFDYCLCPFWETNTGLDYVVLPAEFMKKDIIERGFKETQILTFGLPVNTKYTKLIDKASARETLNLNKNDFVIILYSGGDCISSAYKIIKQLIKCKGNIQIVAICGKNKKEFDKVNKFIAKNDIKNVRVEGFCTTLDLYYSAADVVFTRGGGMGLTEQINKHIPFVLREGLIINERINKKLFIGMNAALGINKCSDAKRTVKDLINNPEKLTEMSKKEKEIALPNSTKNFIDFVLKH